MIHFKDVADAQRLYECLSAPARLEILKLAIEGKAESLDKLAKTLHLTNGAITQHVKKLCDAGLINLVEEPGKRGSIKKCIPAVNRIIIDVAADASDGNTHFFDIPVGGFSSAAVKPYCGLATADGWIGERDDPRYFTYPERTSAVLIYFNSGRLNWTLPAPDKKKPQSVSVSFEISSKPYGYGRKRESAVNFFLNDEKLGEHTVDGEFTDRKGLFPYGPPEVCCYGKYKTVTVNANGAFFDGIKIGKTTINDIDLSSLAFGLSSENGVALFGSGYGDYDCGLKVRYVYDENK